MTNNHLQSFEAQRNWCTYTCFMLLTNHKPHTCIHKFRCPTVIGNASLETTSQYSFQADTRTCNRTILPAWTSQYHFFVKMFRGEIEPLGDRGRCGGRGGGGELEGFGSFPCTPLLEETLICVMSAVFSNNIITIKLRSSCLFLNVVT